MKEIKAYVHSNRIAAVIAALKESAAWNNGINASRHNLTVYTVKGSLVAIDGQERHYSVELGEEVINEYKLELLCEDDQVSELMGIIKKNARTGQAEAGWIYVVDIVQAAPIS
ncbi:nitrogen regulatory protein P-II [Rugosibacter aromaticivorans]|jgi:nitrogen regulatory protein P-II 1|uniref:Nitrogen regulatory protein P-II n=1 Tax=Rugosibacter aromaticivorans TaxID=1565605 RepID=A0A0C5JA27_9PROT|nr:P-II family nitrogen regulator [Rugosibacter aromaticivorans]AJP48593.1 nitrogen regulatory protein P-II [Rugosibacter aromaticivorans]MBH2008438.1 P-II family nitrogen regulator [Xanthomonadaceae bacterium]TBR12631.1 MAG: P-II family nitrogen regulator [Rugosibacter sp.]